MNTRTPLSFAMATAALLVACSSESTNASGGEKTQQALIKCEGANECKGTSECKSSTNPNGCQGLNDCKGQGWISIPKSECDAKGGKVLSEAPPPAAKSAPTPPAPSEGTKTAAVKCVGINECKGHSDCKGESNDCKGQDECKGQGYLEIPSEAACLEKGGMVKA